MTALFGITKVCSGLNSPLAPERDQDHRVRLAHFAISLDSIVNQRWSCFSPAFRGSLQEYYRSVPTSRGDFQLFSPPAPSVISRSRHRTTLPRFWGRTRIIVRRNHVRKGAHRPPPSSHPTTPRNGDTAHTPASHVLLLQRSTAPLKRRAPTRVEAPQCAV